VPRRKRERGRTAGRVTDQVETIETTGTSLSLDPRYLGVEAEVTRRLFSGVHL
jgi:hypothetical protein